MFFQQLRELTGLCLAKQNGLSVGDLAKKCAMEEVCEDSYFIKLNFMMHIQHFCK